MDALTKHHISTIKPCLSGKTINKNKAKDLLALEISMAYIYEMVKTKKLTQKQLFKALGIKK